MDGIDLEISGGEILALVGPSGCGKTTLLHCIAGILKPDAGNIYWKGKNLKSTAAHKRGFGLVFQDQNLFPHKDVKANILFGLKMAGSEKSYKERRLGELLELLSISELADRKVQSLSGGQAQRVALGRALAPKPGLLMLDEPLSGLDRSLRDNLAAEIRKIIKSLNIAAIYVTHDLEEALWVTDKLALMKNGKIHREGLPDEIRDNPLDTYTADFFGLTNQIPKKVIKELFPDINWEMAAKNCLILPESISVSSKPVAGYISAKTIDSRFLGTYHQVRFEVTNPKTTELVQLTTYLQTAPAAGETCYLSLNPSGIRPL